MRCRTEICVPTGGEKSEAERRRSRVGRVILLGTGDPLNEERAQSCLAVPLAAGETMLVDASSGTVLLRQLATAGIALESVRNLFVTHRHFDHVGGLAPLLIALAAVPDASLTVHAAPATLGSLRELLALTIPGVEGWLGKRLSWSELTPGQPVQASDAMVTPFEINHGIECVGLRVDQNGSTAAFAVDTRPCANVVRYAKRADLLVHEAYGPESSAKQAHDFGHSTAAEAGRVASEAGVGRLVLTHLRASRHTAPEELTSEAAHAFGGPVIAARDLDAFDF
jgi:ribonuclease BN (tRNA processing enzyme)